MKRIFHYRQNGGAFKAESESQKAIQAEIEKAGGKYIVARSLDDVKVIFEKGKK